MATISPLFLIDEDIFASQPKIHSRSSGAEGLGTLIKEVGASKETHAVGIENTIFEIDLEGYVEDFNERVIGAYNAGADDDLPADIGVARSLVPAGTGVLRDFSYIAPEIPAFDRNKCVGCMTCVTECPDTAILGKVAEPNVLDLALADAPEDERAWLGEQWAVTTKFFNVPEKKQPGSGGKFGIFIDPTKCKGCSECVQVCADLGYNALKMVEKEDETIPRYKNAFDFFRKLPATPERFISERVLVDMMLADRSLLYVGGAGSCAGCGEATVLRMWIAATAFVVGRRQHRHRQLHRLLHGLRQHLPVQPVGGVVDQLTLREWPDRRDGRAGALGPDGLAGQAAVGDRR
jgi:ferredoxin